MDLKALFGLENKNVLITGAGSGMGLAATKFLIELGANVYATTRSKPLKFEVTKEIKVKNLGDKKDLDYLISELPDTLDAIFLCHGMSDPEDGTGRKNVNFANFYSTKYLTEKLYSRLPEYGSITMITSNGGKNWRADMAKVDEIININDWDAADAWYDANPECTNGGYVFSKECQNAYILSMAFHPEFAKKRRRINAISPGYTATPLISSFSKGITGGNEELGLKIIEEGMLGGWDGRPAQPEEMAYPLVALGSNLCSYVSGQVLYVDFGEEGNFQITQLRNKKLV